MTMSRSDTSPLSRWWWTLDRISLFCIAGLLTVGIFLAFAASPAATGHAHAAGNHDGPGHDHRNDTAGRGIG